MRVDIALCQIRPAIGEPELNTERISSLLLTEEADVFVFPESFITGYGAPAGPLMDRVSDCLTILSQLCRKHDKAIAVGTPLMCEEGITNSIAFLSPDGDTFYDKAHLAKFGIYSEDEFVAGNRPAMGSYHGMRFGMSICYDIYFPEVLHGCSLRRSCVNICLSAAARPSAPYFDRVLPARALENVTYLAFVNNVGPMAGLEMAGGSRALDPLGATVASCGDSEGIIHMVADTEELKKCRETRRHLSDFRRDVDWLRESF